MKEDIIIAWRNLWRNRRRTIIITASIFFAVFFAVIMRSYQLGSYDHMISNVIESFSGYMQVQHIDYQDNPSVDNSFRYSDSLKRAISGIDKVVSVAPHIESFALASNGTNTKGVAVLAIDPLEEKAFSDPENKLVKYRITKESIDRIRKAGIIPPGIADLAEKNLGRSYSSRAGFELETGLSDSDDKDYVSAMLKEFEIRNSYLSEEDIGVLVSDRLAEYLKVNIGDTLVLMGQGYHGASAAGIFPVRGLIKIPAVELDSRLIIMTITTAQKFFDFESKITSLAVNLPGRSKGLLKEVKKEINLVLTDKNTTTKTWEELNPILFQQIQGDNQSGQAMLALLYFIIFFGIFGTVLMMVSERRREFGVLISIGMQRVKLKRIITIEMLFLGVIGLAAGLAASSPFIVYFNYYPILLTGDLAKMMEDYGFDPIMPSAWFGPYFYWQAIIVGFMVLLATAYPLRKIGKLKEIEALRS